MEGNANENELETFDAAAYVKANRASGYRMVVTDGGDESNVTYIFDASGRMLMASWQNQSPIRYWICEKSNKESTTPGTQF